MKTKEMFAMITWDTTEQKWSLELWIDGRWEFSKGWYTKEKDWVHDSILLEIAKLQDLGYNVQVSL